MIDLEASEAELAGLRGLAFSDLTTHTQADFWG